MNYSTTLITRNLLTLHWDLKAQMPHNPASIVRLLYGELAEEKAAPQRFLSMLPVTVRHVPPVGQGHRS